MPVIDDRGQAPFCGFIDNSGYRDWIRLACHAICSRAPVHGLALMARLQTGDTAAATDLAAGTGMIAYLTQPSGANAQKCRNWYRPKDQVRDRGEPALIAGSAHGVPSAFASLRNGSQSKLHRTVVPKIDFHGLADSTVQALPGLQQTTQQGNANDGHR